MADEGRVAVCRYVRARGAEPRLVALLPQREALDKGGYQTEPPGMHMVFLPFADDLREPEGDPAILPKRIRAATAQQVAAAEALVDAAMLPSGFSAAQLPNPHLQRHYEVLEARAAQHALARSCRHLPPLVPAAAAAAAAAGIAAAALSPVATMLKPMPSDYTRTNLAPQAFALYEEPPPLGAFVDKTEEAARAAAERAGPAAAAFRELTLTAAGADEPASAKKGACLCL